MTIDAPRLLVEIGTLLGSSLDYEETLQRLARLTVPAFADLCVIDVRDETTGAIARVAVAHAKPEHEALAVELRRRFPPDPEGAHPVARVFRTGLPELAGEISEDALAAIAPHPDHRRIAQALRYTSYIVVPMVARGRTLGTMSLVSGASGRRYGAEDLALAGDLARRAALAVDNARLYEESERRRREAEALADVGRVLARALDPDEASRRIAETVRALFRARTSAVFRLQPETGDLVALAVSGELGPAFAPRFVLPAGTATVGLAVRQRGPVATADNLADRRIAMADAVRDRLAGAPHRAVLAVPLVVKDRVIGALGVGDLSGRLFTADEVRLAGSFADQAAVALENARLFAEEAARRRQMEALVDVERELLGELARDRLLDLIVRRAGGVLGAAGALYLVDEAGAALVPCAWTGDRPLWAGAIAIGDGVVGRCAEGRAGLIVNDYPAWPGALPPLVAAGLRRTMAQPLVVHDRLLGAVVMNRLGDGAPFDADDLAVLARFATPAAIALHNARLSEDAQRRQHEAEVVAELARAVNAALDRDVVLSKIVEGARDLCGADVARIAVREADGGAFVFRWAAGAGDAPAVRARPGARAVPPATLAGQAFRTDDARADRRLPPSLRRLAGEERSIAALAAPVLVKGRVEAVIHVERRMQRPFGARDEAILAQLADHVAIALTNLRLLQAEQAARAFAEATNRAKDEFLATLSHELRTPLTAVLGWTRLLSAGLLDPGGARRAAEVIERNAAMQARLIDDLLDVSRIISGTLHLEMQRVELVPVVEAAVESVRAVAQAKSLELRLALDDGAGPVAGDPARLQQVVWNLLSNAIKFTPPGGLVEVRLERDGPRRARLRVADSGEGIAPEFLPHVFERFRQAESSTTRRHGGLGLGLAIVRHLVERHGGGVRAESGGPGRGATFTVELPTLGAEAAAAAVHPAASGGAGLLPDLAGVSIVVADDEPDARSLTAPRCSSAAGRASRPRPPWSRRWSCWRPRARRCSSRISRCRGATATT